MPLFKGKASKATPKKAIDYVTRPDKAVIVSSQSMDDSQDYAKQFKDTCDMYGKGSGQNERKYYHFKLSCNPADNPTPQQSHKLAEKVAQRLFAAHECVIATHNDTQTIHTHIIVNAVSFETGRKLHLNRTSNGEKSYARCKDIADEMGAEMGFTPLDWRARTGERFDQLDADIADAPKSLSSAERNMAKRGNLGTDSWKEALRQAIDEAKAHCTDRAEFQQYLYNNFGVTMPRNTKKTISFVHPAVGETYAVRGAKLGGDYTTAAIDQILHENKERSAHNARLLINEEQQPTASADTANPSTATTTAPSSPHIPIISRQPAVPTGTGERLAPRNLSDISAELRSIDEAVQSIAGKNQPANTTVDRLDKKRASTVQTTTATTGEHERSVQQKPRRRTNSHER